ncbi:helix-turn-helix domain-containing protein [Flavisphingomonas formosensis]|uniref:helix-turn-helix domain-containing protein n=1 Tax=Flavisphingomonas formosensis TaxID=861534 RepID=UPI0012FB67C8|nr:helix-turn-helix domain-containing protein [Sphingomonas formosensis]
MDSDDDISRANRAKRGSPYLNTDQAAAYLKISGRLLRRLRRAGKGPASRHHSRFIQYHIDDLDAWSKAKMSAGAHHDDA